MNNFDDKISISEIRKIGEEKDSRYQQRVDLFIENLYYQIFNKGIELGFVEEMLALQREYGRNIYILRCSEYENKKVKLEREIIKNLNMPIEIKLDKKDDQFVLLNHLKNESRRLMIKELSNYHKEEILISIYSISSLISYISVQSVYLFKHCSEDISKSEKNLGIQNLIIDSIGVIYKKESIWINNLLGTIKKSCEYLINIILNEKVEFKSSNLKNLEMDELFIYADLTINYLSVVKSINSLEKMGYRIELKDGILQVDERMRKKFLDYYETLIGGKDDIGYDNTNCLLEEFEKAEGFSPKIIDDYILAFDNKFLFIGTLMNVIEDKLFYRDLILNGNANYDSIDKIIRVLSLKKCEEVDKSIFSTDNRLFRTPIIKIENYYLISHWLLVEVTHYLRNRILKKELSKKGSYNKMVKKLYDEYELTFLEELREKNNIHGGINLYLEEIPGLKDKFTSRGVSKEIDFYFIIEGVLYIVEFKNQNIDNSLLDVCKTYSKNMKNKSKHVLMRNLLEANMDILSKYLAVEIESIKSFLVFKNKVSFVEFYEGEDIYCCNYSDFYEFCGIFYEGKDFGTLCEGFMFFK
jgi:hypothetical protein